MVYFAGHIPEMMKRMKASRERKHSNKRNFKEKGQVKETPSVLLEYKTLPPDELEQLKLKIRKKANRERMKYLIISVLACVLVVAFMFVVFK